MDSKFVYAAQKALRQIGRPARIDEIWEVIEEDIDENIQLRHKSREPKQTLRNEIRKNCDFDHVASGKAYLLFTNPRRGFYGLFEWEEKRPLDPSIVNPTNETASITDNPLMPPLSEEIPEAKLFIEGAYRKIRVNSYERDPRARQACIDHWCTLCAVCYMSFGSKYGALGRGIAGVAHGKFRRQAMISPLGNP